MAGKASPHLRDHLARLGLVGDLVQGLGQALDGRRRRLGRHEDSRPVVHLVVPQAGLAHRGHLRQVRNALVRGHGQGTEPAAQDQLRHRADVDDRKIHRPIDEVADGLSGPLVRDMRRPDLRRFVEEFGGDVIRGRP